MEVGHPQQKNGTWHHRRHRHGCYAPLQPNSFPPKPPFPYYCGWWSWVCIDCIEKREKKEALWNYDQKLGGSKTDRNLSSSTFSSAAVALGVGRNLSLLLLHTSSFTPLSILLLLQSIIFLVATATSCDAVILIGFCWKGGEWKFESSRNPPPPPPLVGCLHRKKETVGIHEVSAR